jgi:hypothetical protein
MSYWTLVGADGSELPLDGSTGLTLRHVSGHGMAPIRTIASEYAIRDGAIFQRQKALARTIQLLIVAADHDECGLRSLRERLLEYVNPHSEELPIPLVYYDGKGGRRSLCCYYDGGLEADWEMPYNTEEILLRLIAYQPYWVGPYAMTGALDVYDAMATPNYIIESDANGNWANLDSGLDNYVRCMAVAPNGDIYVGGKFTHAGAAALVVNYVAMWDGTAWHALTSGGVAGTDNEVYNMAFDAAGNLYVVGQFANAGAGAAIGVAMWDGANWSALGAGLNSFARAVDVDALGNVYVGGLFTTAGGGAALRIAMWAGGVWSAMGSGFSANQVNDIKHDAAGNIYACGTFTMSGATSVPYIAMWNGAAWSALSTGFNDEARSMAFAPNGELYVGGGFTLAGGTTVASIAMWNGVAWFDLGGGVGPPAGNIVYRVRIHPNGTVYISGSFTSAGGLATPMRWALWANGVWIPGYVGTLNVFASDFVLETDRTVLAGGFTTATVPGVTLIDNIGTARAYPIFVITGPGRLLYLINYTTNQVIYFDITLIANETLTIDLSPGVKTVTSSFRGNLMSGVLAGSLTTWYLTPGDNYIGCYVDNASAAGTFTYTPMYWGID